MSVAPKQIIAGLYAAFFNRAPDAEGLTYWEGRAVNGSDFETFNAIASGFSSHAKFASIYDGMTNQEFVEAIYINTLSSPGDSEGISYWTGMLDSQLARSEMVASFVYEALNFNASDSKWDSLSVEDKANATNRKDSISNKADAGNYFVDNFGENTNIVSDDLDSDVAYLASVKVLDGIDASSTSLSASKSLSGLSLFGGNYEDSRVAFTHELLDGKTYYEVWDENGDGVFSDVWATSFDGNSFAPLNGSAYGSIGFIEGSYTITDSGVLHLVEDDAEYFLKIFGENSDLNAFEISWHYSLEEVEAQTLYQAKEEGFLEYLFFDQSSSDAFVVGQLGGGDSGTNENILIPFTDEMLNGTTYYNVWDEDYDGAATDMTAISFNSGLFDETGVDGDFSGSYTISGDGVLHLNYDSVDDDYLVIYEDIEELGAFEIRWFDLDELGNLGTTPVQESDLEFFFYDLESANNYIEAELIGISEESSLNVV